MRFYIESIKMGKFDGKPEKPFDPFHPEESRGREELRKYHGCDSFGACLDDCRQCLFGNLNQETDTFNPEEFAVFGDN